MKVDEVAVPFVDGPLEGVLLARCVELLLGLGNTRVGTLLVSNADNEFHIAANCGVLPLQEKDVQGCSAATE